MAVGRGERVLAEVGLGVQTRHAESVLPALDAALSLAGVGRDDIGAVVVGAGPGSFTGVRVAGATARGLVAALDVPLLAYSSLLALAAGVPSDRPVCALLDARRGEVYGGCWRVAADRLTPILPPTVGLAGDVAAAAGAAARDAGGAVAPGARHQPLLVGDGATRYREALPAGAVGNGAAAYPRASVLLWLAEHHAAAGRVENPAAWEPLYVRGSSAERGVPG